ncbi:hypothetical protein J6590_066921 [Homalodisca vitripennis]|nr:hypothetical protein J6590_066921 [Homalodisca vitripennis]
MSLFFPVKPKLLEESDSIKFLGMYLHRGMTWDDHVESVYSRVTSGLYALRNLAKLCSHDILRMAYFGLVYPHLAYGVKLWGSCANNILDRVCFALKRKLYEKFKSRLKRLLVSGAFYTVGEFMESRLRN